MNQESRESAMRVYHAGTTFPDLTMADYRIEHDSFGEIRVPADRLWGAQTQRSLENFRISGERMPPELIRALARVKRACALVNLELKALPADKANAWKYRRKYALYVLAVTHRLAIWSSDPGAESQLAT